MSDIPESNYSESTRLTHPPRVPGLTTLETSLDSAFEITGRLASRAGRDPRMRDSYMAIAKSTGLRVKLAVVANLEEPGVLAFAEAFARRLCELSQLGRLPAFPENLIPIREVIWATDLLAYTEEIVPHVPLVEVLRARAAAKRPLGFNETATLLRPIAEALDFMLQNGSETVSLRCEEIWMTGPQAVAGSQNPSLLVRPLTEWQDLHAMFSMVCLSQDSAPDFAGMPAAEGTISGSVQWGDTDMHPVMAFARLLYRILNGSEVAAAARFTPHAYVPAVTLGHASNNVIRDIICRRRSFPLVTAVLKMLCAEEGVIWRSLARRSVVDSGFAETNQGDELFEGDPPPAVPEGVETDTPHWWTSAEAEPVPVAEMEPTPLPPEPAESAELTIPEQFLELSDPGSKLILESPVNAMRDNGGIRGIHLSAREEFRIGRTRRSCDFLAWFWPRTGDHDSRTKRLSRETHAALIQSGGSLRIVDHDTTNGTTWQDVPVLSLRSGTTESDSPETIELKERGRLVLADDYQIDVTPFPRRVRAPSICNEALWNGPGARDSEPGGAVRLIPANTEATLHLALWLLTDATFGSGADNPLVLEPSGMPEVAGRFHYYRNQFWIESLDPTGSVALDGRIIVPGEIVPLVSGRRLRLGADEYEIAVER